MRSNSKSTEVELLHIIVGWLSRPSITHLLDDINKNPG